jgi:hypothetical protein
MAKGVGLNKGRGKRNLTIQLDEVTIQAAKELAARKNTSVSSLVTQQIQAMVAADERYREAMLSAIEAMHDAPALGGGVRWTREEINEERINSMRMFNE